jgi:hypothetical protein
MTWLPAWSAYFACALVASSACGGRGPSAPVDEQAARPEQAQPSTPPATAKPEIGAGVSVPGPAAPAAHARTTFLDRLLAVNRGMDGALTPAAMGRIFERAPESTESANHYRMRVGDTEAVIRMEAGSTDAPTTWIEFDSLQGLGVTLADLEKIYGGDHRALPPAKAGTTVVFTPKPGSIAAETYVAARLWSPRSEPGAPVSYLQLRSAR